jgi:hypothetical protein
MRGSIKRVGDTQGSRERREGALVLVHSSGKTESDAPASEPLGMDAGTPRFYGADGGEEKTAMAMAHQAAAQWKGLDEHTADVMDGLESLGGLDALSSSGARAVSTAVTLIVYGWKMVEPGTLWWVFPSVAAALGAAHAMTNAVKWAIVKGPPRGAIVDIAKARASGSVLVEQTA